MDGYVKTLSGPRRVYMDEHADSHSALEVVVLNDKSPSTCCASSCALTTRMRSAQSEATLGTENRVMGYRCRFGYELEKKKNGGRPSSDAVPVTCKS